MRKLLLFFMIVVSLMLVLPVQAQNVTLSINPTSGPPGTVVSFNISAPFATPVRECYANNQFIGNGTSYTIPQGAQGTITFHCDAGAGGEFSERSNDVTFTVTQPAPPTQPPPPSATGGISLSINPSSGPVGTTVTLNFQLSGGATFSACIANGVPTAPTYVVPPEAASVGGVSFRCDAFATDQSIINSNEVFFTLTQADAPPPAPVQPTAPPAPAITLPTLPDDGVCYVATLDAGEVNVRQEASTDAPIVARMNPQAFYEATQFEEVGQNRWYFVPELNGWVAGFVVRATVYCADVGSATFALVEIPPEFDACPDLHGEIATWPPYVISNLLEADDPCAAAFELWSDRLFGDVIPLDLPTSINISEFIQDCPERFFEMAEWLGYLSNEDFAAYQTLVAAIEAQGCAVDIYTALSPEFFGTPAGIGLVIGAECTVPYQRDRGDTLHRLGFNGLEVRDLNPCVLSRFLRYIDDADYDLFDYMTAPEHCGFSRFQALNYLLFSRVNLIWLEPVMRDILSASEEASAFCENPIAYLTEQISSSRSTINLDPSRIPPELQDCAEIAEDLSNWRERGSDTGIYMDVLIAILNSDTPCATARRFLAGEDVRPAPSSYPQTDCQNFEVGGRYYILLGGERVSDEADWGTKLRAARFRNLRCEFLEEQVASFPPDRPRSCYAVSHWFTTPDPAITGTASVSITINGPSATGDGRTAEYALTNPVTIAVDGNGNHHVSFAAWIYDPSNGRVRPFVSSVLSPNVEFLRDWSWNGFVDNALCASGGRPVAVMPGFNIDPNLFIELPDRDVFRIPLEIPRIPPFPDPFIDLSNILIGLFPDVNLAGLTLQPPEEEPPLSPSLPQIDLELPAGLIGRTGDTVLRDRLILGDLRPIERTLYFALESTCGFDDFDRYRILYFVNDNDDYAPEDFADLLRIVPDDTCDDLRQLTSGSFPLEDGTPFFFGLIDGLNLGYIGLAFGDETIEQLQEELVNVCGIGDDQMVDALNLLSSAGISPAEALEILRTFPPEICIGLLAQTDDDQATAQAMVGQCLLNEEDNQLAVELIATVLAGRDSPLGHMGEVLIYQFSLDADVACSELARILADSEARSDIEMLSMSAEELMVEVCGITPEQVPLVLDFLREGEGDFTEDELRNALLIARDYVCNGVIEIARDITSARTALATRLTEICGFSPAQASLIVQEIERADGQSGLIRAAELLYWLEVEGCGTILRDIDSREVMVGTISEVCGFTASQANETLSTLEGRGGFSQTALLANLARDADRMCGDLADLIGLVFLASLDVIEMEIPAIVIPRSPSPEDDPPIMDLDAEPGEVGLGDGEPGRVPPTEREDTPEVIIVDEDDEARLRGALEPSDAPVPPAPSDAPADAPAPPRVVGSSPPAQIVVIADTSVPRNAAGAEVKLPGLPDNLEEATNFISASNLVQTGFTAGVVQLEQNGRNDIYLWLDGEFDLLSEPLPGQNILPALSPDGETVVFISQIDNRLTLVLLDLSTPQRRLRQVDIGNLTLLPFAPAWTPDGNSLLITGESADGTPAIYLIEEMPTPAGAELVVANAASPAVESGGRYMAFVRDGQIFSTNLKGGRERPVYNDEQGCESPVFGADPFTLYFVCGGVAYQYDSNGVNPLPIPNITQITTGNVNGFVTFSDGDAILIARDDGTLQETLIRREGARAIYFGWLR